MLYICICDYQSRIYNLSAGCPQGSCLFPLLYNIFTSDFPALNGCTASIFADDTAILCTGTLASNITNSLQVAFNTLVAYFNKWKILVNSDKTQAIFFYKKTEKYLYPNEQYISQPSGHKLGKQCPIFRSHIR